MQRPKAEDRRPKGAIRLRFEALLGSMAVRFIGETTVITTIDKNVRLAVTPLDRLNAPSVVDGPPVWSTSEPAVGTLAVAPDGLSATFTTAALGITQITVTADGDMGPGSRTVTGTFDIQVEQGEAQTLLIAGVEEPK